MDISILEFFTEACDDVACRFLHILVYDLVEISVDLNPFSFRVQYIVLGIQNDPDFLK